MTTDKHVIIAAQRGDLEAFKIIYDTHKNFVWNVTRKMLYGHHEAEDAFQEAFIRVYERINSFNFKSDFRTWLYRVVFNYVINYAKKTARKRSVPLEYDEGTLLRDEGVHSPKRPGEEKEQTQYLLSPLNPRERMAVVLREFYGHSYAEIGNQMDISSGTVGALLFEARSKMREHFIKGGEAHAMQRI